MTTKWYVYARSSDEVEEKQAQSIDDQINYWKRRAELEDYEIVKIFQEEKSAKSPNVRVEFYRMLNAMKESGVKVILAWKLDRLTRNPVDTGMLQYGLQTCVIDNIITNDRIYKIEDAGLMFGVETGMATQYILDLSKNVKRGMYWKIERGWWIGPAPLGYFNNKLNRTIVPDKRRYLPVREIWNLALSGGYTIWQIADKVNNEIPLRIPASRNRPARKPSAAIIRSLLKNPFYAGKTLYKGEIFQGSHKAMVTIEEFNQVQQNMKWTKNIIVIEIP